MVKKAAKMVNCSENFDNNYYYYEFGFSSKNVEITRHNFLHTIPAVPIGGSGENEL